MKLSKPTAKPINILSISLTAKEYVIYLINRKNKIPEVIAKIADIIEYIVSFISLWNIHLNFKSNQIPFNKSYSRDSNPSFPLPYRAITLELASHYIMRSYFHKFNKKN